MLKPEADKGRLRIKIHRFVIEGFNLKKNIMNNFQQLINSDQPLLVDFFAEWCGPCKVQAPILKQAKDALGDQVRIIKIDVDKNPEVAQRFQVQGVPTLILFKKGEVKWRQSGVVPANTLVQLVHQHH
jgi:thioredoxin 1